MPVLAGAIAVIAAVVGATVAGSTAVARPATAAADAQTILVEDFSYPGAAQIQAQYGITLTSGDGHIVFADCHTSQGLGKGLLQVFTTAPTSGVFPLLWTGVQAAI